MAGIDKIYGTMRNYYELEMYLEKYYPRGLKFLYQEPLSEGDINKQYAVSNFPCKIDFALCKLHVVRGKTLPHFVIDGLLGQYRPNNMISLYKHLKKYTYKDNRRYKEPFKWNYYNNYGKPVKSFKSLNKAWKYLRSVGAGSISGYRAGSGRRRDNRYSYVLGGE